MKKLYYSMGEVSKLTGLAPHVLRNWEKSFDELSPKKNSAGNRAYKDEEVELIFRIKELLMEKKFTTAGVKKVLRGELDPTAPISENVPVDVKKDLTEIKVFLNELLEKL
ncbi:MerR family transcriptional regulator [Balneola vulgaris]|jgi:DNA-binding transcriptional MerR regulator|uniref:MerR family transcriptional regulator n=1 Tax=Balneola vulgaris TaxID=287535 RepID=UPI0005909644|nr:MerR family transcriptional regulator [Balneola vulgaris]